MKKQDSNIKRNYSYLICHRLPDRTFKIKNTYFPVCSRCTGIYIGAIIYYTCSLLFFMVYSDIVLIIAFLMTIPLIIDGLTQYLNLRESNNGLRFITGFAAGIGIAVVFSFIKILIF